MQSWFVSTPQAEARLHTLFRKRVLVQDHSAPAANKIAYFSFKVFVSHILSGFEAGSVCGAVLCDFSKAFNCVNHDILLRKLKFYGIIGHKVF